MKLTFERVMSHFKLHPFLFFVHFVPEQTMFKPNVDYLRGMYFIWVIGTYGVLLLLEFINDPPM